MPLCPTAVAALEPDPALEIVAVDLDPEDGYLPSEALCLVHNLTFHAALAACPDCKELSA